jgi:hypothetical protein
MSAHWENLDVEALLNRRDEQTMSGNVGAYPVPLGKPLRRAFPTTTRGYTKLDHPYLPSTESNDSGDLDYERAKALLK